MQRKKVPKTKTNEQVCEKETVNKRRQQQQHKNPDNETRDLRRSLPIESGWVELEKENFLCSENIFVCF